MHRPYRYSQHPSLPANHPFRQKSLFYRVFTVPLRRLFLCCTPGYEEPYRPPVKPSGESQPKVYRQGPTFGGGIWNIQPRYQRKVAPSLYPQPPKFAPKLNQNPRNTDVKIFEDEAGAATAPQEDKTRPLDAVQIPKKRKKSSKKKRKGKKPKANQVCPADDGITTAAERCPQKSEGVKGQARKQQKHSAPNLPNTERGDAGKSKKSEAAGKFPRPLPVLIKVKSAGESEPFPSPMPLHRRKPKFQNTNFVWRPLPPVPQQIRGVSSVKRDPDPKRVSQVAALSPEFKWRDKPGRETIFPLLVRGVDRRLKCTVYSARDFETVTANGQPIKLGRGTFGQVTLMRMRGSGRPLVALKSCNLVAASEGDVWREVKAMQIAQEHWAFPKLYGIIRNPGQLPAIALEFIGDRAFMKNLTLADAIRRGQNMWFLRNWLWIALDIAKGLDYLHSMGFLHCDLKPNNVLLYENGFMWRAKVIDLGQACRTVEAHGPLRLSRQEQRANFKWFPHVPREVFAGTGGYSVEGDIYSLGYILLEIAKVCCLTLTDWVRQLGDRCHDERPWSRPSMETVIKELTSLAVHGR